MKKPLTVMKASLFILLSLFAISGVYADCGGNVQCVCGDNLTSSLMMNYSIINCPGDGILVKSDNLTLNCNGYNLTGDNIPWDSGIDIESRNNITIRNCFVSGFGYAVTTRSSSYNVTLINNTLFNNIRGIVINSLSHDNFMLNNTIKSNNQQGIVISNSDKNSILGNNITNNLVGIELPFLFSANLITQNNIYSNNYLNLLDSFYWNNLKFIAQYNWWGTTNKTEINSTILGNSSYIPFLCASYPTDLVSDGNGACCSDTDNDGVCNNQDLCQNTLPNTDVDLDGCSNIQFCARQPRCGFLCDLADWKHNEPTSSNPHDCVTVIVHRGGIPYPACASLEGQMCGG